MSCFVWRLQSCTSGTSWWQTLSGWQCGEQGTSADVHPQLVAAVAHAAGRYGHVMFPENAHQPALDVASRLLSSVGAGWASRVFFSDDGCPLIPCISSLASPLLLLRCQIACVQACCLPAVSQLRMVCCFRFIILRFVCVSMALCKVLSFASIFSNISGSRTANREAGPFVAWE